MEFSKFFKKNIYQTVLLSFMLPLCTTLAFSFNHANEKELNFQNPNNLIDNIFDAEPIIDANCRDTKITVSVCSFTTISETEETSTLIECCEQTRENFELTWSLIEELKSSFTCCDEILTEIAMTQSLISECCQVTQSNFEFSWEKLDTIEQSIQDCCNQLSNTINNDSNEILSQVLTVISMLQRLLACLNC